MILRLSTRRKPPTARTAMTDNVPEDQQGETLADAYDLDLKATALREAADAWEIPAPGTPTSIGLWLRARADQLEQSAEQLRDSIPAPPSPCQIIDVDGEPVRVQADPDMPGEVRDALADVVRTVRANHPAPVPRVEGCLFCDRAQHTILGESASWYIRLDAYPANPGHIEVVTKRHVISFFGLDGAESAELYGVLAYARNLVEARIGTPDGWTIGVNEGRAAGRSVDHLHIHLIPRHHGDVPDPRGGIRQCAPRCTPDAWGADPADLTPAGDLCERLRAALDGAPHFGTADVVASVLPVAQAWAAEQTQRAVEAAKDAADETWNRVGVDTLAHWTQRAEWAERERDEARALAARYRMQVDDPDSLLTRLDKAEATVQRAGLVQTVLALFDSADIHSELFWRTDEDDIRLYANVSDIFAWGTADLEEITTDRLSILQRAYDDLIAIDSAAELAVLYAARVRGQRPQGAAYPDHPTARTLLDECGPERPLGLDNPRPPAALDQPEEASDGR